MAVQLILKNSSVEDRRPTTNQLANGEISLNYNEAGAFLCCRDTTGAIQQVGGVKISATAPESPVRQTQWFEPASLTLFIYDGTNWLPIAGGGGGGGGGTGDITTVIGNNGIDASEIAGVVTLNVDLAGGQDGLEFRAGQLSATVATKTVLGSVKIGDGLDITSDGTISIDGGEALQPDNIIGGDGIEVTPGADNVEIDVDLAPNKGLEFIGGQLAANIGDGLEFNPDGSIGIDGDVVLQTGDIIGGDGINVIDGIGTATVEVDLVGGQDGLEIKSNKLTATIATKSILGSVKIGDEISVDADGTISGNPIVPPVISQDTAPDFVEDYIWFDTGTAEAYVGYKDPSNDEYWISLTKVGAPGADGKDGDPVIISQDNPPPFQEDVIWFDTGTGTAYFGYIDPSGDEYWISLSKPGAPGANGLPGKDGDPIVFSQDTAPPFQEDAIWFDTSNGEAYFGYLDPSGDKYWISLSKPGPPGANGLPGIDGEDGQDGDPVIVSQDTAPTFKEDSIWFDTSKGEAYFGYTDPSNDDYWISLSKPGPPGTNGLNGAPTYATVSANPPASPNDGEIWVKDTTGKFYAWWGSQSVWVSA